MSPRRGKKCAETIALIGYVWIAVISVVILFTQSIVAIIAGVVVVFPLIVFSIVFYSYWMCHRCDERLPAAKRSSKHEFGGDGEIDFCPFCGSNIEESYEKFK